MNSRLVALVVPPVLALLAAALYTQYRVNDAEEAVSAFCASVVPGMSAQAFIKRALAAELEVHDFGAESDDIVASRATYSWHREVFECRAERDGNGVVRSIGTARRQE
jgi:hypothetical protein